MKKLFLPLILCMLCAPAFAASNTFSLEWSEDTRVSQWEDPDLDYMETGSFLHPYVGQGAYPAYFINTNPNNGSECGIGWTDNGILTMTTYQAVGNWNQAWTPPKHRFQQHFIMTMTLPRSSPQSRLLSPVSMSPNRTKELKASRSSPRGGRD